MQIESRAGGAFLINETRLGSIHGSLAMVLSGADLGWLSVCFDPSSATPSFRIEMKPPLLTMSLDVAIRFAGVILVAVSQHAPALTERTTHVGELRIARQGRESLLSWKCPDTSGELKMREEIGMIEMNMQSEFASELAFQILRTIGAITAT